MTLKREWPVFLLLAVIATIGAAAILYLASPYKPKFKPNYRNYETAQLHGAPDPGHARGL